MTIVLGRGKGGVGGGGIEGRGITVVRILKEDNAGMGLVEPI